MAERSHATMAVAENGYRLALRKVADPKPESAEEEVVVAET